MVGPRGRHYGGLLRWSRPLFQIERGGLLRTRRWHLERIVPRLPLRSAGLAVCDRLPHPPAEGFVSRRTSSPCAPSPMGKAIAVPVITTADTGLVSTQHGGGRDARREGGSRRRDCHVPHGARSLACGGVPARAR